MIGKAMPQETSSHVFSWQSPKSKMRAFIWVQGNHFVRIENDTHIIIGLGHISDNNGHVGENALKRIEADLSHEQYSSIKKLEGTFSLVTINKDKNRIAIYRNIAGLPGVYYTNRKDLSLFSDNLSYLVRILLTLDNEKLACNLSQLANHCLDGFTELGQTLFNNVYSVMFGEQILLETRNVSKRQILELRDMKGSEIKNCAEQLNQVMREVIEEYKTTYPDLVNIFSGGVDSSFIQAHLSQCSSSVVRTFSLDLIHPSMVWKNEREYARSGSSFFGSLHTFVEVSPLEYPELMVKTISDLGMPLCDSQEGIFSKLLKAIKTTSSTAISGMDGDSLFGLPLCKDVDIANTISRFLPSRVSHEILLKIMRIMSERADIGILSNIVEILELDLHNPESPMHPFNIQCMGHRDNLKGVREMFGDAEVAKIFSRRQAIISQLPINQSLKEGLHNLGLLYTGGVTSERLYQLASNVGLKILFPYLDSRIIKIALSMSADSRFPYGQTKRVIKDALLQYMPKELVLRPKSAWGLPIFEWLAPKGILHSFVKELQYSSFEMSKLKAAKAPRMLLWHLINYNIWHKEFFGKSA